MKAMKEMTDQEAEYLDDLWTRTTPEIDMSRPGYFARKKLAMGDVAPVAVARSPQAQVVAAPLVREKIAAFA
jgi:DNA polymerase/3'-5' exonuclease PolX